jgi:hypothetical protein
VEAHDVEEKSISMEVLLGRLLMSGRVVFSNSGMSLNKVNLAVFVVRVDRVGNWQFKVFISNG